MVLALILFIGAVGWVVNAGLNSRDLSQVETSPPESISPELFYQVTNTIKKSIMALYSVSAGLFVMAIGSFYSSAFFVFGGIILIGSFIAATIFKNKARKYIIEAGLDIDNIKHVFGRNLK